MVSVLTLFVNGVWYYHSESKGSFFRNSHRRMRVWGNGLTKCRRFLSYWHPASVNSYRKVRSLRRYDKFRLAKEDYRFSEDRLVKLSSGWTLQYLVFQRLFHSLEVISWSSFFSAGKTEMTHGGRLLIEISYVKLVLIYYRKA